MISSDAGSENSEVCILQSASAKYVQIGQVFACSSVFCLYAMISLWASLPPVLRRYFQVQM